MGRRLRSASAVLAAGLALALVPTAPAAADKDYRTQRYEATGSGPGSGWVVNIHAEGGVNYGIERYQLRGVEQGTYVVRLTLHLDADCTQLFPFPPEVPHPFETALLTTNAAGNAHGGATFLVRDVAPLIVAEGTLYGQWTFTDVADGDVYATGCEPIVLDLP